MYVLGASREKFDDLVPGDKLTVLQGVQVPDKLPNAPIVFDQGDPSAPTVDGSRFTPKSLFMMTYNDARPECCDYSPYSTSTGCVCLTKDQINFVATRGSNNKGDRCSGGPSDI